MVCFYKSWVHEGSICIRLLLTFKAGLDVSRKRSTMNGKIGKHWKKLSIVLELLTTMTTCMCSSYNLTNFFSKKASLISRNVLPCQIGWILPREAVTKLEQRKNIDELTISRCPFWFAISKFAKIMKMRELSCVFLVQNVVLRLLPI